MKNCLAPVFSGNGDNGDNVLGKMIKLQWHHRKVSSSFSGRYMTSPTAILWSYFTLPSSYEATSLQEFAICSTKTQALNQLPQLTSLKPETQNDQV